MPRELLIHRRTARGRRQAYLAVMRRAAALYQDAGEVAPELGLSAEELVEDGRRFWLRARMQGAHTYHQLHEFIATGESPMLPPVAGDEEPFALPSFFSAGPRMRMPAVLLGELRATLAEILGRPAPGRADRGTLARGNDDE